MLSLLPCRLLPLRAQLFIIRLPGYSFDYSSQYPRRHYHRSNGQRYWRCDCRLFWFRKLCHGMEQLRSQSRRRLLSEWIRMWRWPVLYGNAGRRDGKHYCEGNSYKRKRKWWYQARKPTLLASVPGHLYHCHFFLIEQLEQHLPGGI